MSGANFECLLEDKAKGFVRVKTSSGLRAPVHAITLLPLLHFEVEA